jgi:hypothetical protein
MSRSVRLKLKKIAEIGKLVRFECFVGNRENFVVDALIDFEPMEGFENG